MLTSLFNMELIQHLRRKWIWIVLLTYTLYLYAGYRAFLSREFNLGQLLEFSDYITITSTILGLLIGLLIGKWDSTNNLDELTSALSGNLYRPFIKIITLSIVTLSLCGFAYLEIIFITIIKKSEYITLWFEIYEYIFFFWNMPMISFSIIGYAVHILGRNKWWTYMIILFIAFICSPFNFILNFSGDPVNILNLFNQTGSLENEYNSFLGLNINDAIKMKYMFIFFLALTLLIVILILKAYWIKTYKESVMLWCLFIPCLVSITISFFFASEQLDSRNFSYSINNLFEHDSHYYSQQYKNTRLVTNESIEITKYSVELFHKKNEIMYMTDISFSNNLETNETQWFTFTLYHGLRVKDIKLNHNPIEWSQKGDTLNVQLSNLNNKGILSIIIQGNTGVYAPITEDALFLPSDFPWLPIPGEHKVAGFLKSLHFNKLFLGKDVEYTIKTNIKDIHSNLVKIDKNTFQGNSNGVTLFKANLIITNYPKLLLFAPPDQNTIIQDVMKNMNDKKNKLSEILGDLKEIPSKVIVKPGYCHYPECRLTILGDTLLINELSLRDRALFRGITKFSSLFYAFYFEEIKDSNRKFEQMNLLEASLDLLEDPRSKSLDILTNYESEVKDIAKELLKIYQARGPDAFKSAVKKIYDLLTKVGNASISDISETINQFR